jgi:CubicO group peptidase (beta-lactamase class C family)
MKLKSVISIVLLTVLFSASGQNYTELVDSLYASFRDLKTPGFSIEIIKNDSVVVQRSYGYANVKRKIKLDQNTRMAIGSCSKQFTAYCISILEQEGKLNRTDEVHKYIPELPKYSSSLQIKHLLSHTSGIRDHIVMLGWTNNQKDIYYDFNGTIESLNKFNGLSFTPGESFAYSNTGYVLLALIVERVSGQSFEEFAKQQIFDPLEMSNTEFSFRRKYEAYGEINPYSYDLKKETFKEFTYLEANALGATGVYTTLSDYAKWDYHLSNPPKNRESVIQAMFDSDTLNNGNSVNYNFGFKQRYYKGYRIVEHAGGWANYNFQYTRIPELNLSIIIGSNNEYHYPIGMAEELLNNIIPDDQLMSTVGLTSLNIPESFCTQFISTDFIPCHIVNNNTEFSLSGKRIYGGENYPLLKTNSGVEIDSAGNRFMYDLSDTSFVWYGGSYFNVPRLFTANPPLVTNSLSIYSGVYTSNELGKLTIKYKKNTGTLKLRTTFGNNPRVRPSDNRLIITNKDFDIILIDKNTLLLGNTHVRVKFEKQR